MGSYANNGKSIKRMVTISLILSLWIPSASSFPHPIYRRSTGTMASFAPSRLSQRYAFSWFKDSQDDKKDEEVDTDDANSQLSENIADTSRVIESFKSSQRIGEESGAALQELSATFVEGTSGDGNVKVTFNGQQMPVGVEIDESYLKSIAAEEGKDGVDKLCAALTDAMQSAHYLSGIQLEEKMQSVYSDLGFDSE